MSLEQDIHILTQFGLFAALDKEALRLLAFGADRMIVGEDRLIVNEGMRLEFSLILEKGQYGIVNEDGALTPVLSSSEILIGENFLLNPESRSDQTLRALERCTFLRIKRESFWRVIEEYPHNAVALRAFLRERVENFKNDLTTIWST